MFYKTRGHFKSKKNFHTQSSFLFGLGASPPSNLFSLPLSPSVSFCSPTQAILSAHLAFWIPPRDCPC